jgi:CheY-specific phosphatase CheX
MDVERRIPPEDASLANPHGRPQHSLQNVIQFRSGRSGRVHNRRVPATRQPSIHTQTIHRGPGEGARDSDPGTLEMIAESSQINTEPATLRTILEVATREVFELTVGAKLEIAESEPTEPLNITAMIGLAGSLCGVISVRCSSEAATLVAAKMLGVPIAEASASTHDAVAEIDNMVAGNFKSKLTGSNHCMLSIPTVITGADYQLRSLDVGQVVQLFVLFGKHPVTVSMELHN